jgi:hypothetical protein
MQGHEARRYSHLRTIFGRDARSVGNYDPAMALFHDNVAVNAQEFSKCTGHASQFIEVTTARMPQRTGNRFQSEHGGIPHDTPGRGASALSS